ncbi:MAG: saccharopine dehydrogenase NADP-binding domain-containing protein [Candidatus Aminicenantes bacterium]|nr:MAG: saccharopine dehydrogenase NADP-binding domain-containing protein [Candidatus Aminicenantes bacterium]
MSHFLVLGAGKMGVLLAKDLVEADSRSKVTLADINSKQLRQAEDFIKNKRLFPLQRDVEDKRQREEIFEGKDVVLCALLHKQSLLVLEEAVRKGVHFVDLVGEWPLERRGYNAKAIKKRITLISGLGVSPGITNICVGRAVHLLDDADKAIIYVGGNPVTPRPPLNYRIVYAVDSLLGLYERKVPIFKKGKITEVPALSGIESIEFPPSFEEMECFYTDGLNSLVYTMKGKIRGELAEKTIRYRGHADGIKTLKECGLFSDRPIRLRNQKIIPREVLGAVLDSKMRLGKEKDVTLMRVVVSGKKRGKFTTHIFEMIDYYDSKRNCTSMARTTSFPASIAAQMIDSGRLKKRGSLFPEEIFHAELFEPFIEELKNRGVLVNYKIYSEQ